MQLLQRLVRCSLLKSFSAPSSYDHSFADGNSITLVCADYEAWRIPTHRIVVSIGIPEYGDAPPKRCSLVMFAPDIVVSVRLIIPGRKGTWSQEGHVCDIIGTPVYDEFQLNYRYAGGTVCNPRECYDGVYNESLSGLLQEVYTAHVGAAEKIGSPSDEFIEAIYGEEPLVVNPYTEEGCKERTSELIHLQYACVACDTDIDESKWIEGYIDKPVCPPGTKPFNVGNGTIACIREDYTPEPPVPLPWPLVGQNAVGTRWFKETEYCTFVTDGAMCYVGSYQNVGKVGCTYRSGWLTINPNHQLTPDTSRVETPDFDGTCLGGPQTHRQRCVRFIVNNDPSIPATMHCHTKYVQNFNGKTHFGWQRIRPRYKLIRGDGVILYDTGWVDPPVPPNTTPPPPDKRPCFITQNTYKVGYTIPDTGIKVTVKMSAPPLCEEYPSGLPGDIIQALQNRVINIGIIGVESRNLGPCTCT
jgi:hypothetical protein